MNKAELINVVAEKAGLSKKDTEKAVTALIDTITAELVAGEKVSLVGFGNFDVKTKMCIRDSSSPAAKYQATGRR